MNRLFILFNHSLTEVQTKDAKKSINVSEFCTLDDSLLALWKNIPPEPNLSLKSFLKPILDYFTELPAANAVNYVLVQGEFGATVYLVNELIKLGFVPIYSTTGRKVLEEKNAFGKIEIKRIVEHVCFREYVIG